jgi:hypothetical protein
MSHHDQPASENEDEEHVQNVFYTDVAANTSAHVLPLITKTFSTATPLITTNLTVRLLVIIPVAVEKLGSQKSAKTRTR